LVTDGFTWSAFSITLAGAMLGIGGLGAAFSGYLLAPMRGWERWAVGLTSLLFIAPGLITMAIGLLLWSPILFLQWRKARLGAALPR